MPTRGRPTGVRGGMGRGGTERNGVEVHGQNGGRGRGGAEPMCEEGIIDGEKERGKLQLDTRPGGTDHNLPIQCTTTARDPAGRETPRAAGRGSDGPPFPAEVSSVHPCSRRRTDGRSRTLRRLSPDARGVGYRRSRPPATCLTLLSVRNVEYGGSGFDMVSVPPRVFRSGGRRLGPGSPFMCCFLHHATARDRQPPAWDERRRVFCKVFFGRVLGRHV